MKLLLAILLNAAALYATTVVVPGITFSGSILQLLLAGAIFGLLNLFVRPVAVILSIPVLLLTLGLFYFILNGLLLWGFSKMMPGYDVSGFWAGLLGSFVVMAVNWAAGALTQDRKH